MAFLNFTLETCTDCECDSFSAYDGEDDEFPLIGTACGNVVPQPFRSTFNTMFVVFESDGQRQYDGFTALYGGTGDGTNLFVIVAI